MFYMFELFEHQADVGIRGIGSSLKEAFEETGKALFSVMTDLKKVEGLKKVQFSAVGIDRENLFINYLNELIYLKDAKGMLFSSFKITELEKKGSSWYLKGGAFGEKISKKFPLKTDVKAASYSLLKIGKKDNKFIAQCVVDI